MTVMRKSSCTESSRNLPWCCKGGALEFQPVSFGDKPYRATVEVCQNGYVLKFVSMAHKHIEDIYVAASGNEAKTALARFFK